MGTKYTKKLNAKIMARIIPDSQLEFFDCGHMFMLTKTEEVIPHVRDFVQEH